MPSHLRPRPGTASAVDRLSIGRLVGSQCNFDQSSIVARMSSRAMQNGRSWVKKRNLGQKNETRAEKNGFSALFLSVPTGRGAEFGKTPSGWQIILLRHTGDFQKSVLLGSCRASCPHSCRLAVQEQRLRGNNRRRRPPTTHHLQLNKSTPAPRAPRSPGQLTARQQALEPAIHSPRGREVLLRLLLWFWCSASGVPPLL